jgi:hypothetical protein
MDHRLRLYFFYQNGSPLLYLCWSFCSVGELLLLTRALFVTQLLPPFQIVQFPPQLLLWGSGT